MTVRMIKTTPDCQSPRRRGIGRNTTIPKHGIDFKTLKLRRKAKLEGPRYSRTHVAPAPLPGGYSVGVPPDPIPNSAVKPDCANGTIAQAMEE